MNFIKETFERVVEEAKAKAAGQPRWIAAIDKAVAGLTGTWIVTEVMDGLFITTDSGETYHANGVCQCKAFRLHQPCKHRAAAQLVKRYRDAEISASPAPRAPKMTSAQSAKVENLKMSLGLRGESYAVKADGKDVLVEGGGQIRRVNRKGQVEWMEAPASVLMIKPQPPATLCEGWMI